MNSSIDATIQTLIDTGEVQASDLLGCGDDEIAVIEQSLRIRLPEVYREFLSKLGRDAGNFLRGADFLSTDRVDLLHQRGLAETLMQASGVGFALSPSHFVFMSHQGYQFFVFDCAEGEDPAVWYYLEGEAAPTRVSDSFSSWFARLVEDETRGGVSDATR